MGKDFRRVGEKDITVLGHPTPRAEDPIHSKTGTTTTATDDRLDQPAVGAAGTRGSDKVCLTKTEDSALNADGEIHVGDRVEVGVEFDIFKDIQSQTASWSDDMEQVIVAVWQNCISFSMNNFGLFPALVIHH